MATAAAVTNKQKSEVFRGGLEKALTKKLKATHGFIGDVVIFTRKGILIQGLVISYRSTTVIVEIEQSIASQLGIENNLTVVNHNNYEVR